MTEAVFLVGEGTVTAMAGGPLSLADMGERRTERASHLEFDPKRNRWVVLDAKTRVELYSDSDYNGASEWETRHFNRRLAEV